MRLYLALLSLSFIWGIAFILIKMTVNVTGVWGMVFLRCLIGAIALTPLFIWTLIKTKPSIPLKQLIILGTINAGIPWGLLAWSETVINSNTTSVINALTPIFTALIGYLFFSKRLQKKQWIGILTGFLGIIILMEFQIQHLFGSDFIGIGTMVLATIFYGFGSQYLKKHLQKTDLIITTTVSLFVASLVGLLIALVVHDMPAFAEFDLSVTLIVLALGALGSGLAHIILYYMIINGTPEFATTVAYIIPISAMIASYLILEEPITANLILGMLIIFSGIYLTSRQHR
ncbi:DMT family transporter [Tenuibacillus multivorans]|uniref:EamA domain-containing membrane protein RarD n=1 Tax=Tenuibacillus multivorans TaxID=237069 RepID=A0A1H0DCJ1_9BACI|nr:DMT family transporter [Tenuibacillus multivorans]GEL76612.1 multidrug DMT transporter permease [Tenuibacillus multivorans]SDN67739.1 EamA domain-containing membrane protein RarD [Tenuibacillus multivorans]